MRAPELGNDRRNAKEDAAHAGKDRVPDVTADGNAGQIDGTGLAAEDAGKDRRADLGNLRQKQGKEENEKMTYLLARRHVENLLWLDLGK